MLCRNIGAATAFSDPTIPPPPDSGSASQSSMYIRRQNPGALPRSPSLQISILQYRSTLSSLPTDTVKPNGGSVHEKPFVRLGAPYGV